MHDSLIDVARRYWAAEESRDTTQILAFFHKAATWRGPGGLLRGHDEIGTYYQASCVAYPGLKVEIVGWHGSSVEGAIRWRALFTAPTGELSELEGVNIMRVEDGLIASLHAFFDPSQLSRPMARTQPSGDQLSGRAS
ncbi:nuclear transport factor 2 family protein [Microcella sp.]|uniref:nuclear transport factor 2 family protein n=1 Tax=Microcella sp. TaxID=1913979 RepID=UPI003314818D